MSETDVPDRYLTILKEQLPEKRFNHVLRVAEICKDLSFRYGCDPVKAELAGWFHDIAKYHSPESFKKDFGLDVTSDSVNVYDHFRPVWHAFESQILVSYFFSEDDSFDSEVFSAMRFHTTGSGTMSLLDKILYVGDFIELGRKGESVEFVRSIAERDLDEAVYALSTIVMYKLLNTNRTIHPYSIDCRNSALQSCSDTFVESCLNKIKKLTDI